MLVGGNGGREGFTKPGGGGTAVSESSVEVIETGDLDEDSALNCLLAAFNCTCGIPPRGSTVAAVVMTEVVVCDEGSVSTESVL